MANQFSGDFTLQEVTLYNVYNSEAIDIKKLVLEINLYESVVSSTSGGTTDSRYWTEFDQQYANRWSRKNPDKNCK